MRKCQDRLNTPSKLKLLDSLQIYHQVQKLKKGQCAGPLKMGLTADQTRNNADRNN